MIRDKSHLNPFKRSLGSGAQQAATQNAEESRGACSSSQQHADCSSASRQKSGELPPKIKGVVMVTVRLSCVSAVLTWLGFDLIKLMINSA